MSTKPARTRLGQKYPGGKSLRRAYAALHRRINGEQDGKKTPWGTRGFTKPGSMRG